MADQTSPTPMSPVTFGPTVIPMSPTAEGTQPASAEPGVSSSDVGATRIPLIAPDPVLSTSSYECQRSGGVILCRLVILGCLSIQGLVVSKLCEMLCGELMVLLLHS